MKQWNRRPMRAERCFWEWGLTLMSTRRIIKFLREGGGSFSRKFWKLLLRLTTSILDQRGNTFYTCSRRSSTDVVRVIFFFVLGRRGNAYYMLDQRDGVLPCQPWTDEVNLLPFHVGHHTWPMLKGAMWYVCFDIVVERRKSIKSRICSLDVSLLHTKVVMIRSAKTKRRLPWENRRGVEMCSNWHQDLCTEQVSSNRSGG